MRKPPRFLLYSLLAEGLVPPPFFFPPRRSTHTRTAIAAPPQHAQKSPFRSFGGGFFEVYVADFEFMLYPL